MRRLGFRLVLPREVFVSLAALISLRRSIACLSVSTSRIAAIMKSSRKLFGPSPLKSAAPRN